MLQWLEKKKNAVKMVLVYACGRTSSNMETHVWANTFDGAQSELEWRWLSNDVVGVRIIRFGGELAGWYAREAK